MHQIRCRCTWALVASCSRNSQAQSSRAAVVSTTRAFASSSSSSAFKRDTVKAKLKKERANKLKLEEESSFFSRASVQHAESSTSGSKKNALLNLCDEAIVLSRSSSDPKSFDRVKDILVTAAGIFNAKLRHVKAGQLPDVDMSYDVFLLRSSWLQVVRTIHALVGRDAIEVCSSMMCDYLEWEASLCSSGMKFKDGTEELPSAQAKQQGIGKMHEERFFHGPFLQDSTIILYDLFWHLTISTPDLLAHPGGVKFRRSFVDKSGLRRSAVARKLWEKVSAIPVDAWRKPLSVSWRPYTIDSDEEVVTAQKLVSAAMTMHGEALLRSSRLVDCVELWKSAIPICALGGEAYTASLLDKIWVSLHRTARHLRFGDVAARRVVSSAEEYFASLYIMLDMLVKHQWPEEHVVESKEGESSHEELLEHVVSADYTQRMLINRGMERGTEAKVNKLVKRLDAVLQSYMMNWSDTSTEWLRPPPLRSLKLCNKILYKLITGDAHERPAPEAALKFLQLMADGSSDLPAPDRSTSTRLLRAAREVGDTRVASAVMQALRGAALRDLQGEEVRRDDLSVQGDSPGGAHQGAASSPPPSAPPRVLIKSNFLLLAEDALRHGDIGRMISLLKSAEKRSPFKEALSPFLDATVDQVVFLLYPSLDSLARRARRLHARASFSSSGRTEATNRVAYDPLVLVHVLQLATDQGKTGLAERVWRLIKRASKPKEGGSPPSWGWPIPIRAYTLMMTLYAREVQNCARLSNRLLLHRHRGLVERRRGGGPEVRGWGRVLTGPLRDRLPSDVRLGRDSTARTIVKQEYQELKERWISGTAEPADDRFWKAIDRVFRRKGNPGGRLQLNSEEDVAFYNSLMQDRAASAPSPTSTA